MNNKKKYEMKVLEQGYEDKEEMQLREAKRRLAEAEKPFNPLDLVNGKNILIFIIWVALYKVFIYYEFGVVFFLFTILYLVFTNTGERKPWELSAYSVFNPNFERIPGTFSADQFQPGLRMNNRNEPEEDFDNPEFNEEIEREMNRKITYDTKAENKKRKMKEVATQPLNSACSCGSGKKYKNCCLKKVND